MSELRFVDDMSNSEYHATKAISKSVLDMASRDLYMPMWSRECPQDQEKMKAFDFGDAMHAICLEPDRLKSEFVVMPNLNLRTNAGKQEKAEFEEEHKDSKILTAAEHKQLNLMFESVMAYKPARDLIEADGVAERSYFWTDSQTGLECKCRPDKEITADNLLVDIKTAPDLKKFSYSVDDYRYYVQDPWYCDGVTRFGRGPMRMEFLVIQKTVEIGRYPVMVVRLPEEAIQYGRLQYQKDLIRYSQFLESEYPPETPELLMHYRFIETALEATCEVTI